MAKMNLIVTNLIVVKIFQYGPKWLTAYQREEEVVLVKETDRERKTKKSAKLSHDWKKKKDKLRGKKPRQGGLRL